MPETAYSIGSSMVTMETSLVFNIFRSVYKLVVFPLPVGPVAKIIPYGRDKARLIFFWSEALNPRDSRVYSSALSESKRITAFSP